MNKKQVILALLLFTATKTCAETFAVEMTFPLSALLAVGTNYPTVVQNQVGYYTPCCGKQPNNISFPSMPQVNGYFANDNSAGVPLYIILQRGSYMTSFSYQNGGYSCSLLYLSDWVRHSRSPYVNGKDCGSTAPCGHVGPGNVWDRGGNQHWSFDYYILKMWESNNYSYAQAIKTDICNGQVKSLSIDYANFKPVNSNGIPYYFSLTGQDMYLPLHMIMPEDSLLSADGNFVNFGPTNKANNYNKVNPNTWYPWTYGYCPPNLPQKIVGSTSF
jgi:hypothetical protein